MRLLFVCLGNICRSPTAEGIMRHVVQEAGLTDRFTLDSAGTGSWHLGNPPDSRSAAAAAARGFTLEGSARQVDHDDFYEFDLLLAMDRNNFEDLIEIAPDEEAQSRIRMLREFDPEHEPDDGMDLDVPDPYYGGVQGFDHVIDLVEDACRGLLDHFLASGK